jgi:ABC-type thiamine transport system substrate-binding protein
MNNEEIKQELDPVIAELETQGVSLNDTEQSRTGLGDLVEATLTKFGITEERFKAWAGLNECGCQARKKWLNSLMSWKK